MSKQAHKNKNKYVFSGILVCLFFGAIICANIAGRWFPFHGIPFILAALVIWIVWIIHFGWVLWRQIYTYRFKILFLRFIVGISASIFIFWIASQLGKVLGNALCFQEIRTAAAAGLQEDCVKLLLNWPVKDDRIYDFNPEFSKLPSSIKIFMPAYVINGNLDDTNDVPNIGLCKNGWGGFAGGVRVFRNDQDADKFIADWKTTMKIDRDFGCQRIAPGIYYWWQDT